MDKQAKIIIWMLGLTIAFVVLSLATHNENIYAPRFNNPVHMGR